MFDSKFVKQISSSAQNDPNFLVAWPIGVLVHDEAHHMKTGGNLWKVVSAIASKAEFTVLMTATPIITGCRVRSLIS